MLIIDTAAKKVKKPAKNVPLQIKALQFTKQTPGYTLYNI